MVKLDPEAGDINANVNFVIFALRVGLRLIPVQIAVDDLCHHI